MHNLKRLKLLESDMQTDQKQIQRPFDHPVFDHIRLDNLAGPAYKFYIVFPMSDDGGKTILTPDDRALLVKLLTEDFGGCSLTNDITHPLMQGTFMDKDGNIMKGRHSEVFVYASQTDHSIKYFETLKKILEELSGEEEILVEMSPVVLISRIKE